MINRIGMTALLAIALSATASAQVYDLSWNTIDGGGAMFSTGGTFTLSGTIGQPDAGVMTGGTFTLVGGFWSIPVNCPGDLTGDGIVDEADLGILLAAWMTTAAGDLNGDTLTNEADLGILLANWQNVCT